MEYLAFCTKLSNLRKIAWFMLGYIYIYIYTRTVDIGCVLETVARLLHPHSKGSNV